MQTTQTSPLHFCGRFACKKKKKNLETVFYILSENVFSREVPARISKHE